MKRIISIVLCAITSAITGILALVFLIIEGRILFSGELNTYSEAGFGYFSTIVKVLIPIFALLAVAIPWVAKGLKSPTLRICTLIILGSLLLISISHMLFAVTGSSNGVISLAEVVIYYLVPVLHAGASVFYLSAK